MSETLHYLKAFAQFPIALRRYLQRRLTLEEARRVVRERLARREEDFLQLVDRSVYGAPRSPYLALLKMAGCERGDLRSLVLSKGLDAALRELRRRGVYVTYEEFKGRVPIVRPGTTIPVAASDFDNPFARRHVTLQTGGSTGLATNVALGLDFLADKAPHQLLFLGAYDVVDAPTAYWLPILPGSGLHFILQRTDLHQPLHHWFSYVGWRDSAYWLKYGLATRYILAWMRILGARVRTPEIVGLDRADVIARWIRDTLRGHARCVLHTTPSQALRVALAAQDAGLDLTGATARVGGEPLTPVRLEAMQRVGLRVVPAFGLTETSTSALGCARPVAADDLHHFSDAFALITHPHRIEAAALTVDALVLTSLLASAPKLMLNVQIDDCGVVEERECGCEIGAWGYTTHVRGIHSYSKLVGEGVTLIGNEMLRILEEVLPARFGGSALDYQLLGQEDERGLMRLFLLIHPRVAIAEEGAVIAVVLQALRGSSPMADAARTVWQQARTIEVRRQPPVWTTAGKLLPLGLGRSARQR
jgi:hypothetical protein